VPRCAALAPALIVVLLTLAGCGADDSSTPGTVQGSPPMASGPQTPLSQQPTSDRSACRAQLRTGTRIADAKRLRRLSLPRFQLRSNDMQEVVEEATRVCPPQVVAPLKRSMLRLLATDDYLLRCAPQRTCDATKVGRMIRRSVHLEHRAVTNFK
jgi:hypothetical protein